MRIAKGIFFFLLLSFSFVALTIIPTGCAQVGAPVGGPKDTIPPTLVREDPAFRTTNFSGNKITFTFDEYVEIKDVQKNVLVSPYPKTNPIFDYKLKTVTVKLKDTLLPNTTYAINFGESIKDIHEGNPLKNFTYVFSTGNTIDSFEVQGKIILAQTGKTDSNLVALLYRNANDSSVQQRKPDYLAKVNSDGTFKFINLPPDNFSIYALLDGNGSKTYDSPIEIFAFADTSIQTPDSSMKVLYAYAEEKEKKIVPAASKSAGKKEQKFTYTTSLSGAEQDLLTNLTIEFSKPLKTVDSSKIILTDTLFNPIKNVVIAIDTTNKIISLKTTWLEDAAYKLIIDTLAVTDSADTKIPESDTITFKTKRNIDYGTILIRFKNAPVNQHLVLQFIKGDEVIRAVPITSGIWSDQLFPPGDYDLRILYDTNDNGKWDTGNYLKKIQPEKVTALDKKLNIKANWDNEREIQF